MLQSHFDRALVSGLLPELVVAEFREHIYTAAAPYYRILPWREAPYDPYHVLVSEIMLQQTQVARVEAKFLEFLQRFPTLESLSAASLRDVLAVWSGLGYNRRGVYVHRAAQAIVMKHQGQVPSCSHELVTLPGIGPNTAGSIAAFAYQYPSIFIETNIRAVFLHTCFSNHAKVCDRELMPLIAQTVDLQNPRAWYYALMDYGATIKKMTVNPNRRSKQYAIQSRFEGSDRQIRGAIVRYLTQHAHATQEELMILFPDRIAQSICVLEGLCVEGLVVGEKGLYHIAAH